MTTKKSKVKSLSHKVVCKYIYIKKIKSTRKSKKSLFNLSLLSAFCMKQYYNFRWAAICDVDFAWVYI